MQPGQCATDRSDMNGQQNEIRSVTIVGSGNVAEALARALGDGPFELRAYWPATRRGGARWPASAARRGRTTPARLAASDLCIVAVSDRAVAEKRPQRATLRRRGAVVHTAGCVPLEALPACFGARGVLLPLQTFHPGARRPRLSEVPFFTRGRRTRRSHCASTLFARAAGGAVLRADAARSGAASIWPGSSPATSSMRCTVLRGGCCAMRTSRSTCWGPIIRETAAKAAAASGDPASVQTGPAVRGDRATQERHCELLADDPELTTIYKLISEQIWRISKK